MALPLDARTPESAPHTSTVEQPASRRGLGRHRLRRTIRVAAPAAIAVGLLVPTAAYGDPGQTAAGSSSSISDVTAKLDVLAKQSSILTEQFDTATIDVGTKQKAADQARTQAAQAVADYAAARGQLTETVTSEYEGSTFGSTGALLLSSSGDDYVQTLNTLDVIGAHRADVIAVLDTKKAAADRATHTAETLLGQAKATQAKVAKTRQEVQASIGTYQSTLAKLNAEQQAAYAARNTASAQQVDQLRQQTATATPAPARAAASAPARSSSASAAPAPTAPVQAASGSAQAAVSFALAQIGKPYVFGAAGPGSYDCSGLTSAAWRAGGVSLPHSAAGQYGYGTHVSVSQLQPGDLLFYYSPIGHVTMYVGNGMMVTAPETGELVKVQSISAMMSSFVGATHIG